MFETVQQLLRSRMHDDSAAVAHDDQTWTWREHLAEASAEASALIGLADTVRPLHVGALLGNSPAMLRSIYKDPERYVTQYWQKYPGAYLTGDSARKDEDGYFWIIGRVDDVIKVSGYRLGTAEIESALVSHPAVAEAAAIGLPHELKGNAIHVFVLLRNGHTASAELEDELRQHVSQHLGPIAKPEVIKFVDKLPKTRSGKIMRRLLKARALGMAEGDISTLEE